jgi:hypothetical protein
VLRGAARPYRPDHGILPNDLSFAHGDRAEVDERDGMAAGCLQRHDLSVRADGAREADDAGGRCKNRLLALAGHVDPSVLAASVRVAAVDEGLENLP